jgi:pentachlorophenol monooxygenase/3-(3-hydroxy-phenyl)propionate hydroxylase
VAREGLLLLVAPGAELAAAQRAAEAVRAPVRVLELAATDADGALTEALAARPGEVWVLRPDAHVAAVLEDPTSVTIEAALRRALGDREESGHGLLPTIR